MPSQEAPVDSTVSQFNELALPAGILARALELTLASYARRLPSSARSLTLFPRKPKTAARVCGYSLREGPAKLIAVEAVQLELRGFTGQRAALLELCPNLRACTIHKKPKSPAVAEGEAE